MYEEYRHVSILQTVSESKSLNPLSWFGGSFIKDNPDKYQVVCAERETNDYIKYWHNLYKND